MKNSEGEGYTPMAMHIIKSLLITPMCLSVAITFPGLSKFDFFFKNIQYQYLWTHKYCKKNKMTN